MEAPPEIGGIVARERRAHHVGRGECLAREEKALDRSPAFRQRALQPLALGVDARRFGAQLLSLRFEPGERAVRFRDGALRLAQGVARLAPLAFLALELALQRLDAAAQRIEIALALRRRRGPCRDGEREEERAGQALTLPCAETAAMRFATSSASPR